MILRIILSLRSDGTKERQLSYLGHGRQVMGLPQDEIIPLFIVRKVRGVSQLY